MSYTNALGYSLGQLCGRGAFGLKECSKRDYAAWRAIAVAQRVALQDAGAKAAISPNGSKQAAMDATIARWLIRWMDETEYDPEDMIAAGIDRNKALRERDPVLENPRFPADPGITYANWGTGRFVYTTITEDLGGYIREGADLIERAQALDLAPDPIPGLISDAETRKPASLDWARVAIVGGVTAAVLALVGYGVNTWIKLRAQRGPR